jgi:hypothetical protein
MVDITWSIGIDIDGNGNYSGPNEALIDNVLSASWRIGFTKAYETISRETTLTLILNNSDKRYSPNNGSSPIYEDFVKGTVVLINGVYGAIDENLFVGWIEDIHPTPSIYGDKTVTVEVSGYFSRASRAKVFIPVQKDKTADEVIETILTNSLLYPPGFAGRWLLGETNQGELGNNTSLGALVDYLDADVGDATFKYIQKTPSGGDNFTVYLGQHHGRCRIQLRCFLGQLYNCPLSSEKRRGFSNSMSIGRDSEDQSRRIKECILRLFRLFH